MAKKGGKKGKGKGKGGGGAAGKKGPDVKNIISPGHEVEDRTMYGEGESDTPASKGDAPEAAVAAPPAAAPDTTTSTKIPSAAPEQAPDVSEVQDSLTKAQTPETGLAGTEETLAAVKGTAVPAEAGPIPHQPFTLSTANDATEPATAEKLVTTKEADGKDVLQQPVLSTGSAVTAASGAAVVGTELPERPKAQNTLDSARSTAATSGAASSVVAPHAKRPYETTPFIQDNFKPHKMPKVDDSDNEKAPIKADGALQDGKNSDLHLPGTFPGTPSVPESTGAAPVVVAGSNTVETAPNTKNGGFGTQPALEEKTADVSSIRKDYEQHAPAATSGVTKDLPTTGVAAGGPLEVAGLKNEEIEKKQETQPATQTEASRVTGSADAAIKQPPLVATAAAYVPQTSKETGTKQDKITEPAAVFMKQEVPGSTANTKPSTSIPSLIVSQADEIEKPSEGRNAALASSTAGPAGPGTVAAGVHSTDGKPTDKFDLGSEAVEKEDMKRAEAELQAQEAADRAAKTKEPSGQAKSSEGAAAQETTVEEGKKAGDNATGVAQLQATVAQAQEKAAELENKAKEIEKRRKGGFWSWIRRKFKGDKTEKQPSGAGGSQVIAPVSDRAATNGQDTVPKDSASAGVSATAPGSEQNRV